MQKTLIAVCLLALGAMSVRAAEVASSSASFSFVPPGGELASASSADFSFCPPGSALSASSSAAFAFGEGESPCDIDLGGGLSALDLRNGIFVITGEGQLSAAGVAVLKGLGVTNLVIGAGVTGVGDGAFSGWKAIRDVSIGTDCVTIGANAFGKCYNLTNVTCAALGMTVGDHAFLRCNSLESITFADMPSYQSMPFAFHTEISMRNGMPDVTVVPQIVIGGYEQVLLGKTNLTDAAWCEVRDEATRASCRFFKIELRK